MGHINLYQHPNNFLKTLFEDHFDLMGFYKDKATDKSDFARMWDSSHADYAVETDGFLSRDKRARMKAGLTYYLMGIKAPIYEI